MWCAWFVDHDGKHHDSYRALSVAVPVVLVCVIMVLISCVVVGYSLKAHRRRAVLKHQRLYQQHQAALHAAGHFDDAVPNGVYSLINFTVSK